uniref:hypothetical protein n=1 Tax=Candidatus Scatocola faecipullorum TaxID=2840917 RepID=UPI0040292BC9
MSEQKGVFVLMGLFLLFCRCPVCFLVSRLDSFVFVSLFDFFNVIARLDRAISLPPSPFLRILRSSRILRVRVEEAADDG